MDQDEFLSKIKSLRKKLDNIAAKIKLACELGRKAMADKGQLFNFKGQFRTLDSNFEKFENMWDDMVDLCEMQKSPTTFPTQSDITLKEKVEKYYIDGCASHSLLVDGEQQSATSAGTSRPSTMDSSIIASSSNSFLPKINIPTFDGTLTKWPTYRDLFLSLIHNDESIPVMKKFHYLLTSLRGPALSLVTKLQQIEGNYPLAWKALEDEYENPRLLATLYLNSILNFKPAPKVTKDSLTFFISTVIENISAFRLLEVPDEADFILYYLTIRCLDFETRRQFELENQNTKYPTMASLSKFVRSRLSALQITESHYLSIATPHSLLQNDISSRANKSSKPKTSLLANHSSSADGSRREDIASNKDTPSNCVICSQSHTLLDCLKFLDATSHQRYDWLKSWKGCRNCLAYRHKTRDCRSKPQCRFCSLPHHSLLHLSHRKEAPSASDMTPIRASQNESSAESLNHSVRSSMNSISTAGSEVLLGTAYAEIQDNSGRYQPIRLVVDNGSQYSFISKRFVKRLGLDVSRVPKRIGTIGKGIFEGAKGKATCFLRPVGKAAPLLTTDVIVLDEIVCNLPNFVLSSRIWKHYTSFPLADDKFWESGSIDFLLGCDLYPDISIGDVITIRNGWPKLFNSSLGYIVCGRIPGDQQSEKTSLLSCTSSSTSLQEQLTKFWEIEEPSIPLMDNPEHIICEAHFRSTSYRTSKGQYVVRLPFKSESPQLSDSSAMSLKRFRNLERKLDQKPDVKFQYSEFMTEYLSLNHMSRTNDESKYIIPHHSIVKEDGTKTKLKVVFDCSAATKTGSLNDHLLVGPKLHRDIKEILMSFRLHPVVFVTDIVKMYRFIQVDPLDRPYLHILWRFNPAEAINKYQLNTLSYGLSCAPFLALRVMKQLCLDEGRAFPKAAEAILKDMYIDDLVTGAPNLADALDLQRQVIGLTSRGGFHLSKWSSNREELLHAVQDHSSCDPIALSAEDDHSVKILGLQWDPRSDSFTYNIKPPGLTYTKRSFLSTIARIYDPLGFLSPVVITAKCLIQELWKTNLDWDDPVPSAITDIWKEFVLQLPLLSGVKIQRFVFLEEPYQAQILGFCDASEKSYSSAIYLRITTSTNVFVHLLMAKTKLAPLKTQSIPRLELMGALLLANTYASLSSFIITLPPDTPSPLMFTDSMVALGWIKTPTYRLTTFIANRVNRINELTAASFWHHIASGDNPSDVNSRGMLPADILSSDLWWNGPRWLYQPPEKWPVGQPPQVDLPELKPDTVGQSLAATIDDPPLLRWFSSFSSFMKLLRFFSWLRRWMKCREVKLPIKRGPISAFELKSTETACIRFIQAQCLCLEEKGNLSNVLTRFANLNPFIDQEGIVRVGGRIQKGDSPFDQKHPILLPRCHFTAILVDHLHCIYLHPGPGLLQALMQMRYWVPSLRRLVRQRTALCVKCFRANAQSKTLTPMMADLPKHRLTGKRAFLHVGLDFGGPYPMRYSLQRRSAVSKVYLCLFICMGSKAIHLEAVTSLTTDAFLACLNRFIARRGLPEQLYSDCGTNFVGAANQLKDFFKWYREEATANNIIQYAADRGIKWNFNPPAAPHMGGIWEAGIKSAKSILSKIYGRATLTFEELSTLLCQVEAVLNSRPLCPLSSSPEETEYLSPGHFLIADNLLQNPQPSLLNVNENRLSRWQLVQSMFQHFWKRWHQEYLSTLQRRTKWTRPEKNLEISDLVLIKEPNVPPLHWPLARVTELHRGSDGVVRSVVLRTPSSTFHRPVVKLVPLLPLSLDAHNKS